MNNIKDTIDTASMFKLEVEVDEGLVESRVDEVDAEFDDVSVKYEVKECTKDSIDVYNDSLLDELPVDTSRDGSSEVYLGRKSNTVKFLDEHVNTEDLIYEMKKHPTLWNITIEEYGNKVERRNAWHDIMLKLIPEFDDKPLAEKTVITLGVQKKWKGIRTCYARELKKKKKEKGGASGRKQYIHFEPLDFLKTVTKYATRSMGEEGATNATLDSSNEEELEGLCLEIQKDNRETEKYSCRKSRKITNKEDDELIKVPKKKVLREGENDEDRLFLLSLVSELHKVPADIKLKLKSDIIGIISEAQQTYQQWPQQMHCKTHSTYSGHTSPSLDIYQHTFPEDDTHPLNHPHQSHYNCLQSTNSASTSDNIASPGLSDASSNLSDSMPFDLQIVK